MMQTIINTITLNRPNSYRPNQVAATNESDPPKATPSTDSTLPMATPNGSPLVAVASEIPEVEVSNPQLINLDTAIRNCTPKDSSENPSKFFFEICLPTSAIINSLSCIGGIASFAVGSPDLGTGLCLKGFFGAMGNFNQCLSSGAPNLCVCPCHVVNIDSYAVTCCFLLTIDATNKCKSSIHASLIEARHNIEERYPTAEVTATPEATAT